MEPEDTDVLNPAKIWKNNQTIKEEKFTEGEKALWIQVVGNYICCHGKLIDDAVKIADSLIRDFRTR